MYTISNMIIQSAINTFGTNTIAAWTAFGKIDGFFWMILSAYGISVTGGIERDEEPQHLHPLGHHQEIVGKDFKDRFTEEIEEMASAQDRQVWL